MCRHVEFTRNITKKARIKEKSSHHMKIMLTANTRKCSKSLARLAEPSEFDVENQFLDSIFQFCLFKNYHLLVPVHENMA